MSERTFGRIETQEIAHLAYLNWRHDGCPHGHDKQYWYEAEHQLMATRDLLMAEYDAGTLSVHHISRSRFSRRNSTPAPRKTSGKRATKKAAAPA